MAAALVGQVALMLAHDCLLYEDVPGSFAEPGLDSPGREDQAQAGDQSSAQEHQRAYDALCRWTLGLYVQPVLDPRQSLVRSVLLGMRLHFLWGVVWALPAIVAIAAIPFYMRFRRRWHRDNGQS